MLAGPAVEVADHVHGTGGRRPHREPCAAVARLSAELLVQAAVGALAEEVQVEVRDRVRQRHQVSSMRRTANTWAGPRPG